MSPAWVVLFVVISLFVLVGVVYLTLYLSSRSPYTRAPPLAGSKGWVSSAALSRALSSSARGHNHPVDLVFTWVDPTDAGWREDYERVVGIAGGTASERFPSPEAPPDTEINAAIESALRFAPWARMIYVVTARPQRPRAADRHPARVRVVHHDEIFEDGAPLPVFSTMPIIAHLHHIPGLAERFLHLDDDYYFGNYVFPDDFFTADGKPIVHTEHRHIPPQAYTKHDAYLRKIGRRFGNGLFMHVPRHTARPFTRSICEAMRRDFPKDYEATVAHQGLRSKTQCDFMFTAAVYGLHRGWAVSPSKTHLLPEQQHKAPSKSYVVRPVPLLCFNTYHEHIMAQVAALSQPPPPQRSGSSSILVVVKRPGDELTRYGRELVRAGSARVVFLSPPSSTKTKRWDKTLRVARALSQELDGSVDFIRARDVEEAASALSGVAFDRVYVDAACGEDGQALANHLKHAVERGFQISMSKVEAASLARLTEIYSF